MKPSVDAIMATNPCEQWPRDRVESLFAKYGPFESWTHLVRAAEDAGWPVCPSDICFIFVVVAGRVDSAAGSAAFDDYMYAWSQETVTGWQSKARVDYLFALCRILDGGVA